MRTKLREAKEAFNLHSFYERFPDEKTCREYLKKQRFPDGKVVCPKCGTFDKIYELKDGKRYKCGQKGCKHIFTITVATVFEASHISLHKWFLALYVISAHKKGISSLQLHRDIGVTQKTAWFMLHRIRYMLSNGVSKQLLKGVVEADESYFKGVAKADLISGRGTVNRVPVFGMVERGGRVWTKPVEKPDAQTLQYLIRKNVSPRATIITDEYKPYKKLNRDFNHKVINHEKAYARGSVHTNTIEGYWGLLKRGIVGIYHYVSPKHLHRYCDEFQYRYNTRKIEDAERFQNTLTHSNARLKYSTLIQKESR